MIKRCGNKRRVQRRHEQQAKQQWSSSDGCTNNIVKEGVYVRSGAHVKRGVRKDAQIKLVREERVLGMGNGRMFIPKRCSRVGFTTATVLGMGHGRMFIPKRCIEELPTKKADVNKYKKICSASGCTNVAVQGGVCSRHGAKVKLCSSEGCTNQAKRGGVCFRHGAKVKLCSREGSTNYAKKGGVCIKHGAQRKLGSREECTNQAKKGGVCIRHGATMKI